MLHRGDASKVVRDHGSSEDGHDELDARFARLHCLAATVARFPEMGEEGFLYVRPTGFLQVDERQKDRETAREGGAARLDGSEGFDGGCQASERLGRCFASGDCVCGGVV